MPMACIEMGGEVASISEQLLSLAIEGGALQYGDFTLSSGLKSKYYFDGRLLSLHPEGAHLISQALMPIIRESGAVAIGGPTMSAVPIVAAVAMASHRDGSPIPAFIVRMTVKPYGTERGVEGPLVPGSKVAIVDDVCTSGSAIFHAITAAEREGCTVAKVIAIVDRRQGGSDEIRNRGYDFVALMEATPEGDVRVVQQDT